MHIGNFVILAHGVSAQTSEVFMRTVHRKISSVLTEIDVHGLQERRLYPGEQREHILSSSILVFAC